MKITKVIKFEITPPPVLCYKRLLFVLIKSLNNHRKGACIAIIVSELAPKDANILFVVVILLKGLKFNKRYMAQKAPA